MSSKFTSWIFIVTLLFIGTIVNFNVTFAQEREDGATVTQHFNVPNKGSAVSAAGLNASTCEVTAGLQWFNDKRMKVFYNWQGCTEDHEIRWELNSANGSGSGTFTIKKAKDSIRAYSDTWSEMKHGDMIHLYTWIDGERQADVSSQYIDEWPVWARIHTREDKGGACFRFTGRVDPWGVFTAGDKSHKFYLNTDEWETPWIDGPNEKTVNWHAAFYRDDELTKLRSEFWFTNVPNPCYQEPPSCDGLTLSKENGAPIPESGLDITVTIDGTNGTQYRIVDQDGTVVAGPSVDNTLPFHATPKVTYQAQVFSEHYGWTNEKCTFGYTMQPPPACLGLELDPPNGSEIAPEGTTVTGKIIAENATHYRIVDSSGIVLTTFDSPSFSLHVIPTEVYHVHVYNEYYGWIENGCTFQYFASKPVNCTGVAVKTLDGADIPPIIPNDGLDVLTTIFAEPQGETRYRIMNLTTGKIVAGPSSSPSLPLHIYPLNRYQGQVEKADGSWTSTGCAFEYGVIAACNSVQTDPPQSTAIAETGQLISVEIRATDAVAYRIVEKATGNPVDEETATPTVKFTASPDVEYQAEVRGVTGSWMTSLGCGFDFPPIQTPTCEKVELSIPDGSKIPAEGTEVIVKIIGQNGSLYRITADGEPVTDERTSNTFTIDAKPGVLYQGQVYAEGYGWTDEGCTFSYVVSDIGSICNGVALNPRNNAEIPMQGTMVDVKVSGRNSTAYQIVDARGNIMDGPNSGANLRFHAMPDTNYWAQTLGTDGKWASAEACRFNYSGLDTRQALCTLHAEHYGDPGGLSHIYTWVEDAEGTIEPTPLAIERVVVNWDNHGTINYPTATQVGPWSTNETFTLDSRPEVHDVGFGYYRFEGWVYVTGFAEPAYCQGTGNAPDHDNVIPDPGPFAKDNPEGKFVRSSAPSRLPTVGRVPFDAGNGPDKVELILWAFEKEGRGLDARITGIANEGEPLARLGMESVSNFVKFDGLPAREGIVYGFQISEHGPWGPLFCPQPDSNPTTITVFWGAGGQTWLSDWDAYGDCWWLTVAAALNGWVTVDESVATYNALQSVIDWNGHKNLAFSLAQDRQTGQGPRMQDMVIGLEAREWQGPVVPENVPADFTTVVEGYQQNR